MLNPALRRRPRAAVRHGRSTPTRFVALTDDDGTFKPNAVIDQLRAPHRPPRPTSRCSRASWSRRSPRSRRRWSPTPCDLEHPVLDALAGNATAKWTLEEGYRARRSRSTPTTASPRPTCCCSMPTPSRRTSSPRSPPATRSSCKTMPGTGGTQTIVNALGASSGRTSACSSSARVAPPCAASRSASPTSASRVSRSRPRTPAPRHHARASPATRRPSSPRSARSTRPSCACATCCSTTAERCRAPDASLGVSVVRLRHRAVAPRAAARAAVDHRPARARSRSSALAGRPRQRRDARWSRPPSSASSATARATRPGTARSSPTARRRTARTPSRRSCTARTLPRLLVRAKQLIGSTRMRPFETDRRARRLPASCSPTSATPSTGSCPRCSTARSANSSWRPRRAATPPRCRAPTAAGSRSSPRSTCVPACTSATCTRRSAPSSSSASCGSASSPPGVTPEVPIGISDVQVAWQQVAADLAALDDPLGHATRETQLSPLPLHRCRRAARPSSPPSPTCCTTCRSAASSSRRLRDLELDAADHRPRRAGTCPRSRSPPSSSSPGGARRSTRCSPRDRALLGAKTDVLDRLEADFRLVDEAHAAGSAQLLAGSSPRTGRSASSTGPTRPRRSSSCSAPTGSPRSRLQRVAPHLSRSVAPVWLASPYEVAEVTDTMPFDTVILVDAGATTVAENVGAIRRASRSSRSATRSRRRRRRSRSPSASRMPRPPPDSASDPAHGARALDELHGRSALARLGELLPTLTLTRSYRAGGEDLAELVNRRFYGGRSTSLPWAGSFLGHGSLVARLRRERHRHARPRHRRRRERRRRGGPRRRARARARRHAARTSRSWSSPRARSTPCACCRRCSPRWPRHPELTDFVIGDRAEPFAVLPDRARRRAEPRPRHLLDRLRPHPARPRARRLRPARPARRRAPARRRDDPRPPLARDRLLLPARRTSTTAA